VVPLVRLLLFLIVLVNFHCLLNLDSSYTGGDPIGIELAGALKNIYAIAAGLSDGLGFENNTRAS